VQIIKAVPGTDMQKVSTVDLGDENASITELYVDGNTLIAIGTGYRQMNSPTPYGDPRVMNSKMIAPDYYYGGNATTLVRIYNIADKANPKTVRSLVFDGSTMSTRRIGGKLYLVMQQGMPYWGGRPMPLAAAAMEKELMPTMTDSAKGTASMPVVRCGDVNILPHVPSPSYLIVSAIPTDSASGEVKSDVILGSAGTVYASLNNLYIGSSQWNYVWDGSGDNNVSTTLYRFAFDGQGATFKAKGSVPGTALNQFSMDEHENTFRIATTISEYGNDVSLTSNNLFVLNSSDMAQVGSIEDIAPGEHIKSVRFMGDRAYMVTFQQVDPLFVIDTSDARNPKILGKLKIPGYSDYLHPYDETHLIGFGKEVDPSIDADKVHTEGAIYYTAIQGMKISIFDVSDVANPTEMFKTVIGDRGTESPLLYNHHALLFEKDKNLLSFPVTVYTKPTTPSKTEYESEPTPTFQGAYVYDISLTKGLQLKGKISHYTSDDYMKSGGTWYPYGKDVERVVRIGESLYTISQSEVDSHTLSTLSKQDNVQF
jgi:inhibitor of cysteine peptidase